MRPSRLSAAGASALSAFLLLMFLAGHVTGGDAAPATGPPVAPADAPAPEGWTLVWADEFDGAAIDGKKWGFDLGNRLPSGTAGWGNQELQYYTARADNAFVRDGLLHVRAAREAHEGHPFTSARLVTRGLFSRRYGRFEFRARLPTGKGVWPAIWMLPQDNAYGGWPASGEIDVVEARGQEPGKILGTLHYGGGGGARTHTGKDYAFPDGGTFADFHVYALEWDPGEIRWSVDGRVYQTQNFWWSASRRPGRPRRAPPANETDLNPWPAPFDRPFYLILNVAVGGRFLGNPDAATPFPVEMAVDYVRVYGRAGGEPQLKPRGEGKLPFGRP